MEFAIILNLWVLGHNHDQILSLIISKLQKHFDPSGWLGNWLSSSRLALVTGQSDIKHDPIICLSSERLNGLLDRTSNIHGRVRKDLTDCSFNWLLLELIVFDEKKSCGTHLSFLSTSCQL